MEGVPNNVIATHVLSRLGPVGRAGLAASCRRFRDLERELHKDLFTQQLTAALRVFRTFLKTAWLMPNNGLHGDVAIEVDGYCVGYGTMDRLHYTDRTTGASRREVLLQVDSLLVTELAQNVCPEGRHIRRGSPVRIICRSPDSPYSDGCSDTTEGSDDRSLSVHMITTYGMHVDEVVDLCFSLPESCEVEIEIAAGYRYHTGKQVDVSRTCYGLYTFQHNDAYYSWDGAGSVADLEGFLKQHIPGSWPATLYISVIFV